MKRGPRWPPPEIATPTLAIRPRAVRPAQLYPIDLFRTIDISSETKSHGRIRRGQRWSSQRRTEDVLGCCRSELLAPSETVFGYGNGPYRKPESCPTALVRSAARPPSGSTTAAAAPASGWPIQGVASSPSGPRPRPTWRESTRTSGRPASSRSCVTKSPTTEPGCSSRGAGSHHRGRTDRPCAGRSISPAAVKDCAWSSTTPSRRSAPTTSLRASSTCSKRASSPSCRSRRCATS
jgi:hypothetical protein